MQSPNTEQSLDLEELVMNTMTRFERNEYRRKQIAFETANRLVEMFGLYLEEENQEENSGRILLGGPDEKKNLRSTEWKKQGNCYGIPVDVLDFVSEDLAELKRAKSICRGCPVGSLCLKYAINSDVKQFGVFGNTNPGERKSIRKILKRMKNERE